MLSLHRDAWEPGVNCEEGDFDVYLDELAGETWECTTEADQLSGWWRSWDVEEAYASDWASTYTGRPPGPEQ